MFKEIKRRYQIRRMKAKARKYARQASYRTGDGGRHITHIIQPDVEIAERKYFEFVEWLRENDPDFPKEGSRV